MPVLTDDELIYTIEHQLPGILERSPGLAGRVYNIFRDIAVQRPEIAAILAEFREFRSDVSGRFRHVDKQLEHIGQRFDGMDQRMDGMDQRLDGVDQRLAGIDGRLDGIDERLDGVDQRFEQVDQRFEQVDQRFEQVDKRFDRVDEGIDTLRRSIDRLGSRWGIRIESVFRQTVAELLEKSFGVEVQQRTLRGEQFDCVISDGQHILVEIASSVGPNILKRLERKRELYVEETGVTPARIILATAGIHSRRAQALREAGIDVIEPEEEYDDVQ